MYACLHGSVQDAEVFLSVHIFNWEGQWICSHFLPFAMESVSTTDHYDLTVVHQNNSHSLRLEHIMTMPGSFVEVRLKRIMFTTRVVTMYKLRPRSGLHMPTTPSIWLHIHYTLQVEGLVMHHCLRRYFYQLAACRKHAAAGPKMFSVSVCIYLCVSALIARAIITSRTLLPCDLTWVDFGNLDGCFV